MKVLIVLAHPDSASLNAAIARTARDTVLELGHQVIFHDLYAQGFDPLLPAAEIPEAADLPPEIASHCADLAAAEAIIVVHPNWWGMPPAILKGWVDRVVRPGLAYRFIGDDSGEGVPEGLLKAQVALVFNTSNTPLDREREIFGDPLQRLWKTAIFDLCGVTNFHRRMFGMVVISTPEERAAWLDEVRALIREHLPPDPD